jgi:hypothetical protein
MATKEIRSLEKNTLYVHIGVQKKKTPPLASELEECMKIFSTGSRPQASLVLNFVSNPEPPGISLCLKILAFRSFHTSQHISRMRDRGPFDEVVGDEAKSAHQS